jgi:hypothetical protein
VVRKFTGVVLKTLWRFGVGDVRYRTFSALTGALALSTACGDDDSPQCLGIECDEVNIEAGVTTEERAEAGATSSQTTTTQATTSSAAAPTDAAVPDTDAAVPDAQANVPDAQVGTSEPTNTQTSAALDAGGDSVADGATDADVVVDVCASCSPNATCDSASATQSCACNAGYAGDGTICIDVDECLTDPCGQNAICSNSNGAYSCACDDGFSGDGIACADVDECVDDPCDPNATCDNSAGSFECTCIDGYEGDGITCEDTNECLNGACHADATCDNSPGSFSCECNDGFIGDGLTCTDIDECLVTTCGANATCENAPGSFACVCDSGYSGDGITCTDIDECLDDPCDPNATCDNTVGSFTCTCGEGFVGDGETCDQINVLFVDADYGLPDLATWTDIMDAEEVTYFVETLPQGGNPTSDLTKYPTVIWSVGDRAFNNLTVDNITALEAYLDGGGTLLYAGGHNLYTETNATTFAPTYLGAADYNQNMPELAADPLYADGMGHPITGTTLYTLHAWDNGEYMNMFSGYGTTGTGAQGMLRLRADNLATFESPNFATEYIAISNDGGTFRTVTWGFDLNHVEPSQRSQLLIDTLTFLTE